MLFCKAWKWNEYYFAEFGSVVLPRDNFCTVGKWLKDTSENFISEGPKDHFLVILYFIVIEWKIDSEDWEV